jgi:hypothetical protein
VEEEDVIRQPMTIILLGLLGVSASIPAAAQPGPQKDIKGKKIIEWGWDEPDTKFMRENIEKMEQFPFDGLVFHATSGKGENLSWEVWGGRKYSADEFIQAIDDLKATKFARFTDRFLRVNVTPAKLDWFDDGAWASVVNNFGVAAKLAKEGRCKGFMFDTEQYEGVTVFDYRQQKNKKTFAEYQAKVRQRGREWVKAVNQHYPDITILLTFGYDVSRARATRSFGTTLQKHFTHRIAGPQATAPC